jgi:hypothetical protein
MNLSKLLRKAGYDLIEGPVRNHKPLQLWLKKDMERAEYYFSSVTDAFKSNVALNIEMDPALQVDASHTEEYKFNLGITVLEDILKSAGLGKVGLSFDLNSSKNITISYDDSITNLCETGAIENFFSETDFVHPNPSIIKNANLDNILIISGAVFARNLHAKIETSLATDTNLLLELNKAGDGKVLFSSDNAGVIDMKADQINLFPIAVKAHRVKFIKDKFIGLELLTDHRSDLF